MILIMLAVALVPASLTTIIGAIDCFLAPASVHWLLVVGIAIGYLAVEIDKALHHT